MARAGLFLIVTLLARAAAGRAAARPRSSRRLPALDYEMFKTQGAADPAGAAQGQRAVQRLSLDGRRQFLSRAAAAGRHDLHRGTDAAEFRARRATGHAGRAAQEPPAHEPAGRRRRAEATGTAAASTGSRRTIRSGRRSRRGCARDPPRRFRRLQHRSRLPAAAASTLDYEVFRTRVQPILLAPRKGNARCSAVSLDHGRRQFLSRAAAAGEHDLHRGTDAAEFRARRAAGHAGRTAQEHPAHESAGRGGRREPLARRRQALALAERSGVADAGGVGARWSVVGGSSAHGLALVVARCRAPAVGAGGVASPLSPARPACRRPARGHDDALARAPVRRRRRDARQRSDPQPADPDHRHASSGRPPAATRPIGSRRSAFAVRTRGATLSSSAIRAGCRRR